MTVQARAREGVAKRPAGATGAVAAMLVVVLGKLGVDFTADEAATLIGGLTALASIILTR